MASSLGVVQETAVAADCHHGPVGLRDLRAQGRGEGVAQVPEVRRCHEGARLVDGVVDAAVVAYLCHVRHEYAIVRDDLPEDRLERVLGLHLANIGLSLRLERLQLRLAAGSRRVGSRQLAIQLLQGAPGVPNKADGVLVVPAYLLVIYVNLDDLVALQHVRVGKPAADGQHQVMPGQLVVVPARDCACGQVVPVRDGALTLVGADNGRLEVLSHLQQHLRGPGPDDAAAGPYYRVGSFQD